MIQVRSIGDVVKQLRANWSGYLATYWVFLILLALAATADMLSTVFFMTIDGPQAERHPVIRLVSIALGPVLGPVVGKLCQFAAVVILTVFLRRWAIYIFVAVIILYAWAAAYNVVATPIVAHYP
jgi:hypothetical protein